MPPTFASESARLRGPVPLPSWPQFPIAALAETPPLAQTRYQPRPQAHARYAALYPVYRLLREQMLPVWQARQAALQPLSQDLQP